MREPLQRMTDDLLCWFLMIWHMETLINPQRSREIIVPNAGIDPKTFLVRQHRQLPILHVRSTLQRLYRMMTSSNGNIFRVTGSLCGEFTGPGEFPTQRPVTRSFVVFFDLRRNKRLSKQPWCWWFETPSCSLWRHRNENTASMAGPRHWTTHNPSEMCFDIVKQLCVAQSSCLSNNISQGLVASIRKFLNYTYLRRTPRGFCS